MVSSGNKKQASVDLGSASAADSKSAESAAAANLEKNLVFKKITPFRFSFRGIIGVISLFIQFYLPRLYGADKLRHIFHAVFIAPIIQLVYDFYRRVGVIKDGRSDLNNGSPRHHHFGGVLSA